MSRALRGSQKKKKKHLQNNYLTVLTKHSRPILKPFLKKTDFHFSKKTLKSQLSKMNLSVLAVPRRGCQKKKKLQKNCSTTLQSVQAQL